MNKLQKISISLGALIVIVVVGWAIWFQFAHRTHLNDQASNVHMTPAGKIDCGSETYEEVTSMGTALHASKCFNEAFKFCQPAIQAGTVIDVVYTQEITGKTAEKCGITYGTAGTDITHSKVVWNCKFDPTQPIPALDEKTIKTSCVLKK